ncbi:MAG: hypothetical protein R3A11_03305 [Bdellovibrionota bacterium]
MSQVRNDHDRQQIRTILSYLLTQSVRMIPFKDLAFELRSTSWTLEPPLNPQAQQTLQPSN